MAHLRKLFLVEGWRTEASQQTSIQAQFRLGDVLSTTPSVRTPGSCGCREHHFFLGVVSARNGTVFTNQSIADTIISDRQFKTSCRILKLSMAFHIVVFARRDVKSLTLFILRAYSCMNGSYLISNRFLFH